MMTTLRAILSISILFFLFPMEVLSADTSKESTLGSDNLSYEQSSLSEHPEKTMADFFEREEKKRKYPLKLEWTSINNADFYEIEITRSRTCSRRYFKTTKNGLDIMIFPNARYLWRVMAYSKSEVLTEYSPKHKLYLKAPLGQHIVSKVEAPYEEGVGRDVASESDETNCKYPSAEVLSQNLPEEPEPKAIPEPLLEPEVVAEPMAEPLDIAEPTPEEEDPIAMMEPIKKKKVVKKREPAYTYANRYSLWGRAWVKGGLSFNGYFFSQEILNGNEVNHDTVSSPAFYGEVGNFFSPKFGLIIGGNFSQGEFEDDNSLIDESYTNQKITAEAIYLLGSDWKTTKSSQWHLKLGVGYSTIPIIETLTSTNSFDLISGKVISGRAGVGYKNKITDHFRPELGLSVAYPVNFSTDKGSVDLESGLVIDFSAGINYQLYDNYQIGLFWQSELTSLEYTQDNGLSNIDGEVFIINNHLGLYLGLEF